MRMYVAKHVHNYEHTDMQEYNFSIHQIRLCMYV